jgi:hypothetical protein
MKKVFSFFSYRTQKKIKEKFFSPSLDVEHFFFWGEKFFSLDFSISQISIEILKFSEIF